MIGTTVKNSDRWLQQYLDTIKEINYPKDKIRLAVMYGSSNDQTLKILKEFKKENYYNMEVYNFPPNQTAQLTDHLHAPIFNDWQNLIKEDYFLFLDSGIVKVPDYLIKELLRVNSDVVAPYVWSKYHRFYYDTWMFRIDNKRFHPQFPPAVTEETPIYVDSIGSCFLSPSKVFKNIPIVNPYPTIQYSKNAIAMGYRVVACPYIEVYHEDFIELGIVKNPLSPKIGSHPAPGWVDNCYPVKKLKSFKPKKFSNKFYMDKIKEVEKGVMEEAKKIYNMVPNYREKGLEWLYNYRHFGTFYFSRDPYIQYLQYKSERLPQYFELEATTFCNFKCIMCENTYWKVKGKHMKFNEFKKIADQFLDIGLKEVGLTGIGEMFLNKDFLKFIEYIKQQNPSVFIEIFDTFYYIDEEASRRLLEAGIDKIYMSLDASTKETYKIVRPNSDFDRVVKNMVQFNRIKEEIGNKYFPWMCFHYIMIKQNIHEIKSYLDFLDSLNIDIEFVQYTKQLHNYPSIKNTYIEIPDKLIREAQKRGKELGITTRWNVNISEQKTTPMNTCLAWTQPFIFSTGEIIPCCAMNERNEREEQIKTSMGNLYKNSLKDIWYGERFTKVREDLYNNRLPEACIKCPLFKKPR